jgi:hypothetical protein
MTPKKPAGAKALAPLSDEFKTDPAAWARKLRRNLRPLENGALIEFAIERAVECEALRQWCESMLLEKAAAIADVFLAHGPSDGENLRDRVQYPNLSMPGLLRAAKGKRNTKQMAGALAAKALMTNDTKRALERLKQHQRAGENIWDRSMAGKIAAALNIPVRTVTNARSANFPKK